MTANVAGGMIAVVTAIIFRTTTATEAMADWLIRRTTCIVVVQELSVHGALVGLVGQEIHAVVLVTIHTISDLRHKKQRAAARRRYCLSNQKKLSLESSDPFL